KSIPERLGMELIMGGLRGILGMKSSQVLVPRQPWQLMITLKSMHKRDRAISDPAFPIYPPLKQAKA
ncbi:MAG: hypothetical protein L7F78_16165, partial [Syntrophales bacterium LBB04]|nr:hypothetical protein [Syntrophales bacterium LBB04]